MRYLIIDTEKGMLNDKFQYSILSKEESLAKFKEIWEEGLNHCLANFHRDGYEDSTENEKWEEFKKTL